MLKKISSLLVCTWALSAQAQTTPIGNFQVGMTPDGNLFRAANGQSLLEYPQGSGLTPLFETQLWIYYGQNGLEHGIMPMLSSSMDGPTRTFGPQFTPGAYTTPAAAAKYNRTWTVNQDSVQYHRTQWGLPGYGAPAQIAQFPGSGNPSNGEHPALLPFANQAPDQQYQWQNGDFPWIQGEKSIFALYSDRGVVKSGGNATTQVNVSVEVFEHPLAATDPSLQNAVFTTFRVTNVGTTPIDSLHIGLLADFDIGQADNDYVGTDTSGNFIFGMNYMEDEPANGYGPFPPAMAVLALSHPIQSTLRYNPGMTSANAQAMPTNFQERVRWMKGRSASNAALPSFYGTGDPLQKQGALDDTLYVNRLDRGMFLTLPVHNLGAGQTACYDFAYVAAQGLSRFNSLQVLRNYCSTIQSVYDAAFISCGLERVLNQPQAEPIGASLRPNPTTGHLVLDWNGPAVETAEVRVVDVLGRVVINRSISLAGATRILDDGCLDAGNYWISIWNGAQLVHRELISIVP